MRTIRIPVKWALVAAGLMLSAAPALAAPSICINTRDITSQKVEGRGTAIVFQMRDGTQWRNKLQGPCPDLVFEGYEWTIRNPDNTVCDNQETLRVLHSGEVCMLGKFEKVPAQSKVPG